MGNRDHDLTTSEMKALVRAFDWSTTSLGPMELWPANLQTTVGIVLCSRHPMFLWWGPELVQIYNDAYRPSLGVGKHPTALGQRGRDCWQEIWPIIWPQIDDVMSRGEPSWNEDALVPIFRNGRIEEVYWTYGYSPVLGERGGVDGTLVVCTETTARVLAERRRRTLRDVNDQAVQVTELADLLPRTAEALAPHTLDLPFVLLFEIEQASGVVTRRHTCHLDEPTAAAIEAAVRPHLGDLPRRIGLGDLVGDVRLPGGAWPEPATEAFVARVAMPGEQVATFAVLGLSPRLGFDDAYRDFLQQLSDHLANAGARIEAWRTRELLLADLRAVSRTKDEFLAMLGHELRNPLSPIVTAIELMKLGGSDHAAGLQLVERQVHHLIHLVDDLLDVSRITRGQLELVRAPVELAVVTARAIETASTLIESGHHVLSVEVPADGLIVDVDAVRLAQVIANLLTNAAKYTPPNGHIRIDARRDGGEVVLRVRDDGVGIAPDMLETIFDLFTQVPQDLARSQGGLGLGLSIVKMLTEKHGGTVSARSAGRGHGSEFIVRLPLAAPEPSSSEIGELAAPVVSAAPAGPEADDGARPRRRILIVDDNEDAAWILAETLSHLGHDVQCAYDGPSALRVALEHPPEIALLDIGLPVMDGYELATRLQAEPTISGIRLIALTGYGQAGDRQRSNDAGFAAHLVKPISLGALVAAIDVVG